MIVGWVGDFEKPLSRIEYVHYKLDNFRSMVNIMFFDFEYWWTTW